MTPTRLDGSGEFALSQLASAETPPLPWFWAPWCEVCNHEAPAIERLAADARGELAVVAIGGRDDIANGPAFVTRHRLSTPTVLFDEPMATWQAYTTPANRPACCSNAPAATVSSEKADAVPLAVDEQWHDAAPSRVTSGQLSQAVSSRSASGRT